MELSQYKEAHQKHQKNYILTGVFIMILHRMSGEDLINIEKLHSGNVIHITSQSSRPKRPADDIDVGHFALGGSQCLEF